MVEAQTPKNQQQNKQTTLYPQEVAVGGEVVKVDEARVDAERGGEALDEGHLVGLERLGLGVGQQVDLFCFLCVFLLLCVGCAGV